MGTAPTWGDDILMTSNSGESAKVQLLLAGQTGHSTPSAENDGPSGQDRYFFLATTPIPVLRHYQVDLREPHLLLQVCQHFLDQALKGRLGEGPQDCYRDNGTTMQNRKIDQEITSRTVWGHQKTQENHFQGPSESASQWSSDTL